MPTTDIIDHSCTERILLPELLLNFLNEGNAITLWRMPGSNEKHLLICTDGVLQLDEISLEESKTGFVFAPFDRAGKKMFFKGDLVFTFKNGTLVPDSVSEEILNSKSGSSKLSESTLASFPVLTTYIRKADDFKLLVQKSVEVIREGILEKVVPSRTREVSIPDGFNLVNSFNKLCDAYPDAMITLVSSKSTGTWMGASPELIVSVDDHSIFRTVALAGTQRFQPGMDIKTVAWTEKEIEEQALVSRYIAGCFNKVSVREFEEHGPRTSVAGNLLHLKTEFQVDTTAINFPQLGSVMLKSLHPTSAVCGMPLDSAQKFLQANEGYDRQYYAGFLGPVNFKNESHMYVNLRCLQLSDKKLILYAGAGVTIDSIPENEWDETEMKFDTLLSIIN